MSKKSGETRIMVFGTFDGLHKGHLNFFRQARKLAKRTSLIVSIARDTNVKRIKGENPSLNENKRKSLVQETGLVDKAVLSGKRNHIPHILKEKPNIVALGYDQKYYTMNLKKELKNKGLLVKIVRLKPFKVHVYKNSLIKKKR